MIFWGITPFQSAIIKQSTLTRNTTSVFPGTLGLFPLEEQSQKLTSGFAYIAYNIAWFNLSLPPYMTKDTAYDSISTADAAAVSSIFYSTREYSASLDCVLGQSSGSKTYTDGRGCYYQNLYSYQGNLNRFLTFAGSMTKNETLLREVVYADSNQGNCSINGRQTFALFYSG